MASSRSAPHPGPAHHGGTAALVVGATGVVFGDIGTSPLYAMKESLAVGGLTRDADTVLGIASLIFWALTLVVTIKYLTFIMRADNHGEGGILALLALLPDFLRRERQRQGHGSGGADPGGRWAAVRRRCADAGDLRAERGRGHRRAQPEPGAPAPFRSPA